MLINIFGAKCIGINAVPITVEVDISNGIGLHLVGLADVAVRESLLRTTTALHALGYRIPGKRIVINLAPADLHKKGSGYDLPIAIGIIAASGQAKIPAPDDCMIMGELGLDGTVRAVAGALPMAEMAAKSGFRRCILPKESAEETSGIEGLEIYGIETLDEAIRILSGVEEYSNLRIPAGGKGEDLEQMRNQPAYPEAMDFADIVGQEGAKRGMEIAAGGGHNALLVGPPGAGKSSLALATANILPPLAPEEALQTRKIYSVAGKGHRNHVRQIPRPFRNPHYSASVAALIGGGSDNIMPGEISLAHNGVLFIDEFCEVSKKTIDALRSPMEERKVSISRLRTKIEYPANFMLIAATNPCPCGYYGEGDRCSCTPTRRSNYLSRLSGPIMDRIDLHLWLKPVSAADILRKGRAQGLQNTKADTSAKVAERVKRAREIQKKRFATEGIFTNAAMNSKQIEKYCRLSPQCESYLEKLVDNAGLSARACHRILKIARTIADLEAVPEIEFRHLAEAVSYRFLDKQDIFE